MRARGVVRAVAAIGLCVAAPHRLTAQEFGLGLGAGYFNLTQAGNSSKAVFGSSGGFTFGGDLRLGLGRNLYVSAGARYFKKTGERVFVANSSSTVFPLKSEPLSVRLLPIEATLGYRFKGQSTLVPYVGIGGGLTLYHEESTVGGLTLTTSETKGSAHALAGVEIGRGEVRFAAEVKFSTVPNSVGVGGVSQVYNEKDIGGLSVLGKIVFLSPRH